MSRRFRKRLVWTCIATGVLALGAGCATNDAIEEGDFADDELIEEQEGVLDPDGVGGAGDEGIREEDNEDESIPQPHPQRSGSSTNKTGGHE